MTRARGAATALCALFLLAGCDDGRTSAVPAEPPRREASESSSLSSEYRFEPYPGSRWYGPDGDEIPEESNLINAISGPDHCEWQSAVMLHVGWPLGHDSADAGETEQYLRDPEGVFALSSLRTTFDDDVKLPSGARNTGYRTDFMELWLDPSDPAAAYLVFSDHVERWPRAKDPIACG